MEPDAVAPTTGSTSTGTATLAAFGSVLLWCWSVVCFAQGGRLLGPMTYLTLMSATGALTVVVVLLVQGRSPVELMRIPLRVKVAGFVGVSLYTVLLATAFGMAADRDVGQVGLLNYLWPIWIVLLSVVLLDEKPRRLPLICGSALAFFGVAVARGTDTFTRPPASFVPHALALVCGFLWALYCVLLRRWRVPEEQGGTGFHFAACAIVSAIVAGVNGEWASFPGVGREAAFWVLFGGVGPIGLAYSWWELGVKRGNVCLISVLAYFIPVGAAVLVGIFFRQSLSLGLVPGALMIAMGGWLVRRATDPLRAGSCDDA